MVYKLRERPAIDPALIGANRSLRQVLVQLADAEACARRADCNPWEFAVELEVLISSGLTANDLRWLVKMGCVEHAHEITRVNDTDRKFQPCRNLGFTKRTCFILSAAGSLLAAELGPAPPLPEEPALPAFQIMGDRPEDGPRCVPSWDSNRRVLCVNGRIVKQFKVPSPSQEAILAAFEEEGWPSAIDDPLPPLPEQDPKRRLRNTIQSLNANQKNLLLRFRGDGSGQRILWELSDDRAAKRRRLIDAA